MKVMQICPAEAAAILDWFEAHEDLMRHTASGQYLLAARLANFIGLPEDAAEHRRCAEWELAFETMDEAVAEEPEPTPPEPGQRVRSVSINVRQRKIKLNY